MVAPHIVCLGEALIDFLDEGEGRYRQQPGGAPLNVACGAAHLGARAAIITKLGRDRFGDFLEDIIRAHRLNPAGVKRTGRANTCLAFVHLDPSGDRSFSFYRKPCADQLLEVGDIEPLLFDDDLDVFHFGSISCIQEPSKSATLAAIDRARKTGALISFDPNLRPALWPNKDAAKQQILELVPECDVLKVSHEELEFLMDGSTDEHVRWLQARGPSVVVVTQSARGARVYFGGSPPLDVAAPRVNAVDTTGAGDAFVAAFLCRLVRSRKGKGRELDLAMVHRAARWGTAAGALSVTKHGAIPSLPSLDEVRAAVGEKDEPELSP